MTGPASPSASPTGSPAPRALRRAFSNPVTIKELRSQMRGRRAFVLLTFYLALTASLVILVYSTMRVSQASVVSPYDLPNAGRVLFGVVLALQTVMVVILAPTLTSGAISGERERQTLALIRTTLLPASSLVAGKLLAGLSYTLLLLFTAVPFQSIAFLLGGITLTDLLLTQIVLLVTAIFFAAAGLYYSARLRRTLVATVNALTTAVAATLGLPVLLITSDVFGLRIYQYVDEEALISSTNLIGALLNVLQFNTNWTTLIIYCSGYTFVALLLLVFTVRRLNRAGE